MAEDAESSILHHPILGTLRGHRSTNNPTIQYRGIKFAKIPKRWCDPIIMTGILDDSQSDYTKFGPACPQGQGGLEFDISLVGNIKLQTEKVQQSELECLNLNITLPVGFDKRSSKLPIIVWMHGGGLSVGCNAWPQYDMERFVARSVEIGKPLIGISINYRIGPFGFLASQELDSKGNFGFKDQICAYEWIQRHAAGFGGDAQQVTAMGESAGAISLSTLLILNRPLFRRAILMSGDATLRKPRRISWHDRMYNENIKILGLESISPLQRVHVLRNMAAEDLVAQLPIAQHWCAVVDGELLATEVDLGVLGDPQNPLAKPEWCEQIIVGDTMHDGTILKSRVLDDITALARLKDALSRVELSSEEQNMFLEAYELVGDPSNEVINLGLLNLMSDLRFYLPVLKTKDGWSERGVLACHEYHFHHPNPVDGDFTSYASHAFDIAMVLHNYDEFLPQQSIKLGNQMSDVWIGFAYGGEWLGRAPEDTAIFGPGSDSIYLSSSDYDSRFRKNRGQLMLDIGWKRCFDIAELLQGVLAED